jgi:acyl-CoA synthetase (AMP-forming)/AMP-acid ligase II
MRVTDPSDRSLIDMLRDRAAAQPGEPAYTFLDDGERPGATITWGSLDLRSRSIAAAIRQQAEPGARVLVMFPPSIDFIPAFFASLYAGVIAVPAYPPSGARADRAAARLGGMIRDAGIALALAPASLIGRAAALELAVPELRGVRWLDTSAVDADASGEWLLPGVTGDSIAFLQYTSGSTSSPRGVMVTHQNLLHNLAKTAADGDYTRDSVSVSWLPVNHDMGLINGILQPAFSGFHARLMAPAAFLQRPARWLHAISRFGATHSGGPNFAYDLCTRRVPEEGCPGLDLSCWRVAYSGSEPVRRSTLESFHRRFAARGFAWKAFSPAYGLAESTLLVTSVPAGVEPSFDGDAVASGLLDEDRSVVIVDPTTRREVRSGATGEIWTAGDSVAAGYWRRPVESAETFRAWTADGRGPYLRTGDLGFIREARLFVTGRIKDVLIVRGVKHYPQDLELTAEGAHAAIRPGCCAAVAVEGDGGERVAVVAEIDPRADEEEAPLDLDAVIIAIRVAVSSVHHVSLAAVTLVGAGTLPKTTSGKLQRYLCRAMLAGSRVQALASWRESDAPVSAELAS